MKGRIIIVFLLLTAVFCGYAQNQNPMDIILLLDTSSGMFSSNENVNNYITGKFLSEYLRIGDTFHLLPFSDNARVDAARRINGRGDVETIIGRMLLQYPLVGAGNLNAALSYAEQYITSLPNRPKKIVVVTSASAAQTAVNAAKPRFTGRNSTLDLVIVTPGQSLSNLPYSGRPPSRTAASSSAAATPAATSAAGTSSAARPAASQTTTPAAQPSSQAATQTASQTAPQTAPQSTAQSATQTTPPSTTQSAAQTTQSTTQPSSQTAPQSAPQTATQTSPQSTAQTTIQSSSQTATQSAPQTATQPETQSAAQSTTQPSAQPAAQPASEQSGSSTAARETSSQDAQGAGTSASASGDETAAPGGGKSKEKPKSEFSFKPILIALAILAIIGLILLIFFIIRNMRDNPGRAMAKAADKTEGKATDKAAAKTSSGKEEAKDASQQKQKERFADHSSELASYAAARSTQRTTPYSDRPVKESKGKPVAINTSGPLLLNLFVEDQNTSIGKRNIHSLKSGYSLSVGGGNSDFLIFLVSVPPKIGEIKREGGQLTFIPKKPKYFPDIGSNEVKDCINKTIRIISDKNYELRFRFEMYEDPLVELNRLLNSVRVVG